jgi:hypothetical protein
LTATRSVSLRDSTDTTQPPSPSPAACCEAAAEACKRPTIAAKRAATSVIPSSVWLRAVSICFAQIGAAWSQICSRPAMPPCWRNACRACSSKVSACRTSCASAARWRYALPQAHSAANAATAKANRTPAPPRPLNQDTPSSAATPAPPLASGDIHNQASALARIVISPWPVPDMIFSPQHQLINERIVLVEGKAAV